MLLLVAIRGLSVVSLQQEVLLQKGSPDKKSLQIYKNQFGKKNVKLYAVKRDVSHTEN